MKVKYIHEMVDSLKNLDSQELKEYEEKDLPADIIKIINTHKEFSRSGKFGEEDLGSPQEYEKLIVIEDSGTREFEYYNKGIYYMAKGGEEDRPVFKVFATMMSIQRK